MSERPVRKVTVHALPPSSPGDFPFRILFLESGDARPAFSRPRPPQESGLGGSAWAVTSPIFPLTDLRLSPASVERKQEEVSGAAASVSEPLNPG